MMKKPKNSPRGIITMTLLVPALLIAMGLATGMTPMQEETIKGTVVFAADGSPAPGTSVVIANSTVGTVVDIDGTFMLNVEGDPDLVFSYVGYATLKVKASKIGKKPLELEAKTFKLDLETVPLTVIKENSSSISVRTDGNEGKDPVFVMDGTVVSEIEGIDPETIESIDVIKDPENPIAKEFNAKNGVVFITTKKYAQSKKEKEVDVLQHSEEVFYVVEDMPMFPGGKAALKTYIYSNLEYPSKMKKKGTSGEVMVQFTVPASGELRNIKAMSSSHKEFEASAIKVFEEMPNWSPGKQRGKPVMVKVVVPVRFNADKE